MSHPGGAGGTRPGGGGGTRPGGGGGTAPGRGVLIALLASLDAVIATATRQLPKPTGVDEELGQAALMLHLQQARAEIDALLHPHPLRSLGQQVAAHAEHVAVRPVAPFPIAATPQAWGRKSC
jgi:hypothetical protein